jgi:dephospho-CoA kinase
VVQFFAEAGWRTVSSDAVARAVLAQNQEVRSALRERWGEVVFDADGAIDRKAVAARVFADEMELNWLEHMLHPLVRVEWEGAIAAAPEANWLVEIPLLFEKRLETHFDLTVCVVCPPDVVDTRMVRRAYTAAEVEQRRRRQMPLEEKSRHADFVISNAGSLEFLKQQTTRLIEQA